MSVMISTPNLESEHAASLLFPPITCLVINHKKRTKKWNSQQAYNKETKFKYKVGFVSRKKNTAACHLQLVKINKKEA